jgi:hypothetical protein
LLPVRCRGDSSRPVRIVVNRHPILYFLTLPEAGLRTRLVRETKERIPAAGISTLTTQRMPTPIDDRDRARSLLRCLNGQRSQAKFRAVDSPISKTPIAGFPLARHLREHRLVLIDVVIYDNIEFRRV